MDDLKVGELYYVTMETSDKVELRREPTLNSKTEAGQDNVLLSLPPGAELILESKAVGNVDGHVWYNFRYVENDIAVTGWVASDSLQTREFLIPVTGGREITDVYYMGNRKFDIAYMPSEPGFVPQGFVKFQLGDKTMYTSLDNWNAAGGPRYKIS